jgi:hypothetical protein
MSNVLKMLSRGGAGEATDEHFENTVLLLHGDGTNGAQNNTFLDSSSNNFTITRNGNTTQGTFTPFSKPDGRWGNFFDGASNLSAASAATLSGDFTLEAFVYITTLNTNNMVFGNSGNNNYFGINSAGLAADFGANPIRWNFTWQTNRWYHIALSRSSNTVRAFVDGSQLSLTSGTATDSSTFFSGNLLIGRYSFSSALYFTGYISNARTVSGGAIYTGSYAVPTAPLGTTVSAGTVNVLTCQSNRFIDNSSNAFAITRNGNVRVTPFSPFPITTAYDTSVNGGAGYFDGSGDYLSNASNIIIPNTGDFTLQALVYPTQVSTLQYVLATTNNSGNKFHLYINSSAFLGVQTGGSFRDSSTTKLIANSWNHIACTRTGSTYALYVNGVSQSISGSGTMAATLDVTPTYIASRDAGTSPMTGYMSSLNITTIVESITIPTAPYTSSGNTSLLCNFTNAGILDNTCFNALETVGNAQIDTSVKKYGTGSMKFDGTGDYVVAAANTSLALGGGDFTAEMWLYPTAFATYISVWCCTNSAAVATGFHIGFNASGQMFIYQNSAFRISSSANSGVLTLNQWNHVAVVRSSGVVKIYVDGTAASSTWSTTQNFSQGFNLIGAAPNGGSEYYTGYIDDLRITKGIARYTTTFTPPDKSLPDVGE